MKPGSRSGAAAGGGASSSRKPRRSSATAAPGRGEAGTVDSLLSWCVAFL